MQMKTIGGSLVVLAVLLQIGTLSGIQVTDSMKSSTDIAVVVNPKNDTNELSSAELRSILLGERRFWKNKLPLTIVLREPGSRECDNVIASLKMSNGEFGRLWRDKVFRGEASAPPLEVRSNGLATQVIRDNPGSVTFLAGKNLARDVKVLKIDGKWPGETGYRLK